MKGSDTSNAVYYKESGEVWDGDTMINRLIHCSLNANKRLAEYCLFSILS